MTIAQAQYHAVIDLAAVALSLLPNDVVADVINVNALVLDKRTRNDLVQALRGQRAYASADQARRAA